jgi:hypothetical protein
MPKLVCPCGYAHDLSPIPDAGWIIVRDEDYEELVEAERRTTGAEDSPSSAFVRLTGLLYDCPECGRVMWQRPGEERFKTYRLEEDGR